MKRSNQVSEEIKKIIDQKIIPGASWAMIDQSSILCQSDGTFGFSGAFSEKKVTGEELYDLASLTKVIGTTTRVLQLIDEKKWSFSTKVCEILPQYPCLTMDVKDLLLHQSGLPADVKDKSAFSKEKLNKIFSEITVSHMPKQTIYSDLGYLLLGMMIEATDRISLDKSFNQFIFQPLGMECTHFYVDDPKQAIPTGEKNSRGLIQGVVNDTKAYRLSKPVGSAGLFSSVMDIAIFTQAMLKKDIRLFSKVRFRELMECNESDRTFGWEVKQGQGYSYLFHTGYTGTSIGFDWKTQRGLVILTNRLFQAKDPEQLIEIRDQLYKNFFTGDDLNK